MVTSISKGVKITVNTLYQEAFSRPLNEEFLFIYTIEIQNLTESTVQLLRRHWYIFDSRGEVREVEGEGVIGLMPIIEPGETHIYESACKLNTEVGTMHGTFLMKKLIDGSEFTTEIPKFELITPYILN